ncbi:Hypothetical protein NAEGRDRAFT_68748 [Naegleria gruberi]|uniref:MATH domain-containing protein n=1 Tax=Naegleria gruberi TaxID=5762 RepID=D2VIP3_NAEGR|nr:uncharacterized protein NAEGRDRAFT_68748 [Naegleria gruberi]EFC43309.1 Hypothetical protein NAEGRDRAFT_68748 [Naegleria gruberi]|eukprot:XP_002676053.1 Hypothetical protein NAEGRDRAFT_68748 [Naegleria gruberi strain NEG-M]
MQQLEEEVDNQFLLIQGLSHEVWFEHILPFLSSSSLLSSRLINRNFSSLILSYIIKFKSEFKIQVGYPNVLLAKIVQSLLTKLQNLKTITYEDYNLLEDFCLTDQGLSELHPLQYVENVDFASLGVRSSDGLFIKEWIDRESPILQSLRRLSVNYVIDDVCVLLDNFENLKSLRIVSGCVKIKLPSQLEELEIVGGIEIDTLHQIVQQCPNLKRLCVNLFSEFITELRDDLKPLKNLTCLRIDVDDVVVYRYDANFFESLKSFENLTELQVPWPISDTNSIPYKNLNHLGQLSQLTSLKFKTVLRYRDIFPKSIGKVVETISSLHSLTSLFLDFSAIDVKVNFSHEFFDNIPKLHNLEEFTYADEGGFSDIFNHFCVTTLKHLSFKSVGLTIQTDQYYPNLECIQMVTNEIEEDDLNHFKMIQQVNLSKVKILKIGSVNLETLELISQMTNLEELSIVKMRNISSFKTVKLPKLLRYLVLEECHYLTGNEEDFFESFIESCPLLEKVEFCTVPLLQDSFVKKICAWIENGADHKKLFFWKCASLTNDMIYSFKDITKCKFVIFQECPQIHYTREISEILTNHEFIQIFGGFNSNSLDTTNTSNYVINDLNVINSLETFETVIRNSLDLKQHQKAFFQMLTNMFEGCISENTKDEKPLYRELQKSEFETQWFFYYSFVMCAAFADRTIDHCFRKAMELVFTESNEKLINTQEKKKLLIDLLEDLEDQLEEDTLKFVIEKLLENRYFDKTLSVGIESHEWHEKLVDSMSEEDIFQLPYLHNLLNLNTDLLGRIVKKSQLFKNCASFIQKLQDTSIGPISDPESLDIRDRVPERFKNAFLTEVMVPMGKTEWDEEQSGESLPFEAFGYRWVLKLSEEGGWLSIYLSLASPIPISNGSETSEYETLTGNDGSSIEISFMLLNFDNNPHTYFSGRNILSQSERDYYLSIRSNLVQKFSEDSYKFLIGMNAISIKEKIPCPFLSSKYSIHRISFHVPLELKNYYYNEIKVYSDPITTLGTKWTVKLEKKLDSGIFGLYLMLSSFDLYDEKSALSKCRVFFHFANKNLHPDSTHSYRKTFSDTSSSVGGQIVKHRELFKPMIINGERFETYDISLIMEIKSIF